MKYHFVHEVTASSDIVASKFDTKKNPIDMLTKTLLVAKFEHCSAYLVFVVGLAIKDLCEKVETCLFKSEE